MPTILVTDAHLGSAISVIRSLGRRGHRVIAAGWHARSPGFYSRHAAERLIYPPPAQDSAAAVEALVQAIADRGVDLVVPVTDEVIFPLVAARDRLPARTRLAVAAEEALALARDKPATLELARRLGVPVPRSVTVRTAEEARDAAAGIDPPMVVKPQWSRVLTGDGAVGALEVSYARGRDELEDAVRRCGAATPLLVQEYCPGPGVGVELLAHEGRPLAAFQHRRLREVPITGGASSLRESVPLDPELLDHSLRLIEALRWTGLAMVEFKLTPRGPRLMEINGRIWGSLPLAVRAGMDFPARMADLFLNGPPESAGLDTDYEVGVRSRNLELDMVWVGSVLRRRRRYPFLAAPRRREALRAAAGWLSPADGFDILSASDPRPGLAELSRLAAKIPRKVVNGR